MNQTLNLLKIQGGLGQTVKTVTAVLKAVVGYLIFLLLWVILFSFLHRIAGNKIPEARYQNIFTPYNYILESWSLSTGGMKVPNTRIWLDFEDDRPGQEGMTDLQKV